MSDQDDELAILGVLAEPSRRALYDFVVDTGTWVSRETAAEAVGLERSTAAHHLDRLVRAGLLVVDYQRLTGRSGPGAGRPAKLYQRAPKEFSVSLPKRDYELAGELLAVAAETAEAENRSLRSALADAAAEHGRRIGASVTTQAARSDRARRRILLDTIEAQGFEPAVQDNGDIVLGNCTFHRLAQNHTELICNMNVCLMSGLVEEIGAAVTATLDPVEGRCCVRLMTSTSS